MPDCDTHLFSPQGIKFLLFFPYLVEIAVAEEPYESLGKYPTEGGIELILPLFVNKG